MAQCSEEVLLSRMSQINLGFNLISAITDGKDDMTLTPLPKGEFSVEKVMHELDWW